MLKYNRKRPCKKCGSYDIGDRFVEKDYRIDISIGDLWTGAECDLVRRQCRNCSYKWSELQLDSKL